MPRTVEQPVQAAAIGQQGLRAVAQGVVLVGQAAFDVGLLTALDRAAQAQQGLGLP